jgi:acyl-CoA thioesterase-1
MMRNIFTSFFIAMLLVFASAGAAEREPAPIRVACVGDSITFGAGIRDRATNSYPAQLAAMLGDGYDVRNFGVNGATMLKKGNKPYCRLKPYKAAQEFEPNVVIIKLGTNDTKPGNWQHADELEADYTEMVTTFQGLDSKPTVYVCYPVPVVGEQWGISDARVREGVIPVVDKVAKATGATVVDLYEPLKDKPKLLPDKVHPNAEGAKIIAQTLAGVIAPNAPPPPEEEAGNTKGKRQIYLLIGQSNMAGRAPVPDEDAGRDRAMLPVEPGGEVGAGEESVEHLFDDPQRRGHAEDGPGVWVCQGDARGRAERDDRPGCQRQGRFEHRAMG